MEAIPYSIRIGFIMTTLLTIVLFYRASGRARKPLLIILAYLALQGAVSLTGFYTHTDAMPPRFPILAGPALAGILILFVTQRGRTFLDKLDLRFLTLLHVVRIAVELVLFSLYLRKGLPLIMTFEGRNYDILSGFTAPIMYYFAFVSRRIGPGVLLVWNFICLGLLINVVTYAILSVPAPYQQFGFEQPNVALLYFPFTWLPAVIVPLVLLSHLASIRLLWPKGEAEGANAAV